MGETGVEPLYRLQGGVAFPGPLTAGPWAKDAQHGGPVAALLARTVESVAAPAPMAVVRLSVELLSPVPLVPLQPEARVARPGSKIQLVDASLAAAGTVVAKARALRVRLAEVQVPRPEPGPPTPSDPIAGVPHLHRPEGAPGASGGPVFHLDAMEMRFIEGSWESGGHCVVWQRLRVPVVDGEEPSPLQRAAAAADSGNGISRVVPFEDYFFVNPDLTVALSRPAVGEWIGLDVRTRLNNSGWGQAESLLFDTSGPFGRAVQSLYVDRR